jgi:phage/conjugal plasmid C-4 type zinc finger TraR family protein
MRYRALDPSGEVLDDPLPVAEEADPTGRCVDCGGAIPSARLRAIPGVVRCVSCQREHESQTG